MIFAGDRALSRDHNEALKKFGEFARVERVWSNKSDFCIQFATPFGWCNNIAEEDSLFQHVQQYLKDRVVNVEVIFVNSEDRDLVRYFILSISSMHGKVSCQTIWEMQTQLKAWEISSPEIERLTYDAVARIRRDGNFTDTFFAHYLWAEEHHRVFRSLMQIGIPAKQAVRLAKSRVADSKLVCHEPPYYVIEGDHSMIIDNSHP